MKRIKLLLIAIIIVTSVFFITGCKKKDVEDNKEESKTVATTLIKTFESTIKKDKNLENVAKKIVEDEVIVPEMQTFEIAKDDYLAGFTTEIKGFKKAYGIAPMIGTIPFIAYIFEVENPADFKKTLEKNADLRWNICVEADEMKTTVVDNYVFFIMSPSNFEE